jgi:hypothetical protein
VARQKKPDIIRDSRARATEIAREHLDGAEATLSPNRGGQSAITKALHDRGMTKKGLKELLGG